MSLVWWEVCHGCGGFQNGGLGGELNMGEFFFGRLIVMLGMISVFNDNESLSGKVIRILSTLKMCFWIVVIW